MTFIANRPFRPIAPIVLSAPHGGRRIPRELLDSSNLSEEKLLATSDFWTDKLANLRGDLAWITADMARILVDLNRAPALLDPAIIEGVPATRDVYVHAGYGVIPRFAERGRLVRQGKITISDADKLIEQYHLPYHKKLSELLKKTCEHFNRAILIDIHTAPSNTMKSVDVVIGTDYGASLHPSTLKQLQNILKRHFNRIETDHPFSGGYITKHYNHKLRDIETVQIEINRNLVEDKNRGLRQDFFKKWAVVIEQISVEISNAENLKIAAE